MYRDLRRIRDLVDRAEELDAAERRAFLMRETRGEPALAEAVWSLLDDEADERDGFLEPPEDTDLAELRDASPWIRLADRELPLGPGTRLGEFELVRALGSGGMGLVFEARQDTPSRRVALKVLRGSLASARSRRRFGREIQVLAELEHPGCASVFASGVESIELGGERFEVPWYAMEFVPDALGLVEHAREHDLDTVQRVRLVVQVARALEHAHRRGVVHRDLKSENCLVDGEGNVKVIDFGVARRSVGSEQDVDGTRLTQSGQVLGTLATMAPEQLEGDSERIDARTDVWAVGVLMHELLTGRLPHETAGIPLHEVARRIADEPTIRPSRRGAALPAELETILMQCLEREPSRRYATARDLADDLERWLAGEPIQARPPGVGYLARSFARRNRVWLGAGAAVMVASLVGTLVSLAYAQRAEQRGREAEQRFDEVRELADELMGPIFSEIASLPGSLSAQRRVYDAALRYLERFEDDAGERSDLQLVLAKGFVQLGVLRGGIRLGGQGRYEEGLALLERASAALGRVEEAERETFAWRSLDARVRMRRALLELRARGGEQPLRDLELVLGQAEALLPEARASGADHEAALDLVSNGQYALGTQLAVAGRLDRARPLLEQAFENSTERLALLRARAASATELDGEIQDGVGSLAELAFRLTLTGAHDEAEAIQARAREHLGLAPDDVPASRKLRLAQAGLLEGELNRMRNQGRLAQALERADACVELRRIAERDEPDSASALRALDVALGNRAGVLRSLGRIEEAALAFRDAAEIAERMLAEDPSNVTVRRSVGYDRIHEGEAWSLAGEPAKATAAIQAGCAALEALLEERPGDPPTLRFLARGEEARAKHLLRIGRFEELLAANERFRECAAAYLEHYPGETLARQLVIVADDVAGVAHQRLAEDDARESDERARHARAATAAYGRCLEQTRRALAEERGTGIEAGLIAALEAELAALEGLLADLEGASSPGS